MEEANVRGAGEDGNDDDGVDGVGAGQSREVLDEGGEAFGGPGGRWGRGDGGLAAEASGEEGGHGFERIGEGDSASSTTLIVSCVVCGLT